MKKTLVTILIVILCLSLAACGSNKKPDVVGEPAGDTPRELSPAFTIEELKQEIDFEAAEANGLYITAESGNVTISSGFAREGEAEVAETASFRSSASPDAVWSDYPVSYGNDEFTLPDAVMMSDGSLGSLSIPKIKLTVPIYETDDEIEAMAHGVAHMKETSCWAGNVGLAGHNSGVNTYFANLYKLKTGDEIKLTTAFGTRTYSVTDSVVIDENDWSRLMRTEDNRITLITCINTDGSKRLCISGVEKTK